MRIADGLARPSPFMSADQMRSFWLHNTYSIVMNSAILTLELFAQLLVCSWYGLEYQKVTNKKPQIAGVRRKVLSGCRTRKPGRGARVRVVAAQVVPRPGRDLNCDRSQRRRQWIAGTPFALGVVQPMDCLRKTMEHMHKRPHKTGIWHNTHHFCVKTMAEPAIIQ